MSYRPHGHVLHVSLHAVPYRPATDERWPLDGEQANCPVAERRDAVKADGGTWRNRGKKPAKAANWRRR